MASDEAASSDPSPVDELFDELSTGKSPATGLPATGFLNVLTGSHPQPVARSHQHPASPIKRL